jgi:hypothetical protein
LLFLVPFFSHQTPFDIENDSDEATESQNEDDQPSNSQKNDHEGKQFKLFLKSSKICLCSLV